MPESEMPEVPKPGDVIEVQVPTELFHPSDVDLVFKDEVVHGTVTGCVMRGGKWVAIIEVSEP